MSEPEQQQVLCPCRSMQRGQAGAGKANKEKNTDKGKDTDKDTGGKDANTCVDTKRKLLLRSGLAHGGLPEA